MSINVPGMPQRNQKSQGKTSARKLTPSRPGTTPSRTKPVAKPMGQGMKRNAMGALANKAKGMGKKTPGRIAGAMGSAVKKGAQKLMGVVGKGLNTMRGGRSSAAKNTNRKKY